jgi:tetratricopeptide (TPR) repeat protein
MPADPRRVQAVFLAAVEATPGARTAVLDRECGGDPALRQRVADLLRVHDLPGNALDTPVLDGLDALNESVTTGPDDTPFVGSRSPRRPHEPDGIGGLIAGRYRLAGLLGEGGMGTVYRARQLRPVRRTVAIKLVKPGLGSANMLARFRAERQALALMDHPNIARVLDAGETSPGDAGGPGRPYFVMELVEGTPLNRFCDDARLDVRARLELFLPVCQAVQHAHQKGVIHRDLKPGNVLVAVRDGRPVPVVIDFGVAKSTGEQLADGAAETGTGVFIGSFDYMAPEQAALGSAGVDTRADVYALGAMLYELLTGAVPHDRDRLRRAAALEVARLIQDEDSPAASTRVTGRRAAELRGDLDWVLARSLAKDRDRRYPTASAFADDIGRYLRNEPVEAGPPSALYRVRKFIGRHRVPVAAALLLAVAALGGVAGTAWGLVQARKAQALAVAERDAKDRALVEETHQRLAAQRHEARADAEAAAARAVLQFLQNDVLRQVDPNWQVGSSHEPDPNLTMRAALDRSAASVERRFKDRPAEEAAIRRTIGCAYEGLGEYGKAIAHLTRSLALYEQIGADDDPAVTARYFLAVALGKSGKSAEAADHLDRVWNWRRERLGPNSPATLSAQNSLAVAYVKSGRPDDADRLLADLSDRAAALSDPKIALATINNLAFLDAERGRLADAVRRLEDLHRRWAEIYGPDAPQQTEMLNNLGQMYQRVGRFGEAVHFLEAARDNLLKTLPPEHLRLSIACSALADAYWESGRPADAGATLRDSLERVRGKVGSASIRTLLASVEWAMWAAEAGDRDQAETIARESARALARLGPAANSARALATAVHARCLLLAGRPADAEPLAREALSLFAARKADTWPTADTRALVGLTLTAQHRWADAEPFLSEAVEDLQGFGYRMPFSARRKLAEAEAALSACQQNRAKAGG